MVLHIVGKWRQPAGDIMEDIVQKAHLAVMQALHRGTFESARPA